MDKKYTVWFTLNRACNLRCKWCYGKATQFSQKDEMSVSLCHKLLDILDSFAVKKYILIGGEPTIHPSFFDIISEIHKFGGSVAVITNGITFSKKSFLEKAITKGMSGVTLSLKAPSDILYKEWTGVPAFELVVKSIENIKSLGVPFTLSLVLGPELYGNLNDLIRILTQLNVNRVYLNTERPVIVDEKIIFDKSMEDVIGGLEKTISAFEKAGISYVFKASIPFCLIPPSILRKLRNENKLESGCQILSASGLIFDTNGDLLVCNQICQNPLARYGSDFMSGGELFNLLNSTTIKNFYKFVASYPHKKCITCKDWSECGGGCRINWLYENMLNK